VLEDVVVGPEPDLRASVLVVLEVTNALEVARRLATLEGLAPECAVALDLDGQPLGEGVHHGDTDAVEPAGDLVGFVVELPAGVEDRHDDLHGRPVVLGVGVHGDPSAVVGDGHGVVLVDGHADRVAVASQRLVDRVVDDLVDQVVEPPGVRRPDVHGGPLPDCLEALQHLDLLGAVGRIVAVHEICIRLDGEGS
jgi:hypothetical protein